MSARILVAEDSALNRKLVVSMLQKLGYEAHPAEDGAMAAAAAQAQAFSAVLMDCQMPVMDGYQAAAAIRAAEAGGKRLPIIALTGEDTPAERDRCLKAGMDDFLPKPVGLAALSLVLSRWAAGAP
jgi:CheY-like chemotaxis protein